MSNQLIHCIVKDCKYYGQGNICTANEIIVATNQFISNNPDEADFEMASELNPQKAGNLKETCCKTYVPKNQANQ